MTQGTVRINIDQLAKMYGFKEPVVSLIKDGALVLIPVSEEMAKELDAIRAIGTEEKA